MISQFLNRIVVDPDKFDGQPHVRGTHFTVSAILYFLAAGMTIEDVLNDYPPLHEADIRGALIFSAILLDNKTTTADHSPLL